MSQFLQRLTEVLASGMAVEEACSSVCREHGRQRAQLQGVQITDVLVEYRLLRRIVLSVLESDRPLAGHGEAHGCIRAAETRGEAERHHD